MDLFLFFWVSCAGGLSLLSWLLPGVILCLSGGDRMALRCVSWYDAALSKTLSLSELNSIIFAAVGLGAPFSLFTPGLSLSLALPCPNR